MKPIARARRTQRTAKPQATAAPKHHPARARRYRATNPSQAPGAIPLSDGGCTFNALQHGLRSAHVLLPGDNVAAFRAVRRSQFLEYQPRTDAEARCVETIVAAQWRIARCQRVEAAFDHHFGVVVGGAVGAIATPDAHALYHRGMDCGLREARFDRHRLRAMQELEALQRQRANRLQAGALQDVEALLAAGDPAPEDVGDGTPAPSRSRDEESAKTDKPAHATLQSEAPALETPAPRQEMRRTRLAGVGAFR